MKNKIKVFLKNYAEGLSDDICRLINLFLAGIALGVGMTFGATIALFFFSLIK